MKPKEGGGKAKKKKWSKGKVRDKLNNMVYFDKATYEKFLKDVPQYKVITPSVVSERLKIRGSLARRALDELHRKGKLLLQWHYLGRFYQTDCSPSFATYIHENH